MSGSRATRWATQVTTVLVAFLMVASVLVIVGAGVPSASAASTAGTTAANTPSEHQYIVTVTSGGQSATYLETVSNGKVVSMVPTGTTPAASATPPATASSSTSSVSTPSSSANSRAPAASLPVSTGRGGASAPVATVPGAAASPPPPDGPGVVHVYAETNSTSIQTYPLPQVQEFTPGSGSGTVPVTFVSLYLSGSGTASFSLGSTRFGSDVVTNTTVVVTHAGWYNVTIRTVNLNLGSNYYLSVYQTSGTVTWGYTALPTIKINTLTEYYYVGSTFTGSTTTPDLYMIGGVVSPTLYPVTFTETGMPTAAGGGVSFNGGPTTAFTTGGTVVFNAADGTYNFVITPGTGYALVSPSPGTTVTVSGGPASVNVVFQAVYTVTFSETGLLPSAMWSATLNSVVHTSTGTSITFSQPNGTNLAWSVYSSGYSASPASGTVTVSGGSPSTISITFTSTGVRTTIYAETNATSILTYANPQIEQFTVGTGVGTVPVNFVTLYLSGTGTVSFSIGTQKFASNELANTSVRVAGPGWYNISLSPFNLPLSTNLYLNVYTTSGSVFWGYTATPTIKINTIREFYYVGSTLTTSSVTPDLYSVGYSSPITVPLTASITSRPPATLDVGQSATLTMGIIGGLPPYTFTLTNAQLGGTSNLTGWTFPTYDFTPATAGSYTFYFNATDAASATSDQQLTLTVYPTVTPTLNAAPAHIQSGGTSTLYLNVTGGLGPYTWTLQKNGSMSNIDSGTGAANTYLFSTTHQAVYTFYYNVTDANGQTEGATGTVTVAPVISATFAGVPNAIDVTGTATVQFSIAGGVSPFTWTIAVNGSVTPLASATSSPVTTGTYTFFPNGGSFPTTNKAGVYTFYFNLTDSSFNTVHKTATVVVSPTLTASVSALPTSIDVGQSSTITYSVSGGTNTTWTLQRNGPSGGGNLASGSGGVSTTYAFTPSGGAFTYTFYLNATDQFGVNDQTTTVTVSPALVVTLQVNPAAIDLAGISTLFLNFTGGLGSYSWTLGVNKTGTLTTGTSSGTTYSFFAGSSPSTNHPGTYTFFFNVTDANSNQVDVTAVVVVNSALSATLTANPSSIDATQQTSTLTIAVTGGTNDSWTLQRNGASGGVTIAYGSYTTDNGTFGSYVFSPTAAGTFTFYLNVTSTYGPANGYSDTFSTTGTGTVTVPVGSHPYALAYDASNGYLYVANSGDDTVSVIDSGTNFLVTTIDLSFAPDAVAVGNGYVYVAGATTVVVIDPSTNTVVATVTLASGISAHALAYDSADKTLWVVEFNPTVNTAGQVEVVDVSTPTSAALVPGASGGSALAIGVGPAQGSIAYDPADGLMLVTSYNSQEVSVFDASTYALVTTVSLTGYNAEGIAWDSATDTAYVATFNANDVIPIIDCSTTCTEGTPIGVGNSQFAVGFDPVNGYIYLAIKNSQTVTVIDGQTNTVVVGAITVGHAPRAFAYASGNGLMYVANYNSGNIAGIEIALVTVSPALVVTATLSGTTYDQYQNTPALTLTLGISGGKTPYAWTVEASGPGESPNTNQSGFALTGNDLVFTLPGTFTFYFNVTDTNGMTIDHAPLVVVVSPALVPSITPVLQTIDVDGTTTVHLSYTGGLSPVSWTLQRNGPSGGGNLATGTGEPVTYPTISFPSAGVYTLYFNLTDANSNVVSGTATVTVNNVPSSAEISGIPDTIDVGQTSTITILVGTGGTNTTWTLTNNTPEGGPTALMCAPNPTSCVFTPSVRDVGTWTFYLNVSDDFHANFYQLTIGITVSPQLVATLQANPLTVNNAGTSTLFLNWTGGLSSYSWTLGVNKTGTLTTGTLEATYSFGPNGGTPPSTYGPGTYEFFFNVTDANGETSDATVMVTVSEPLGATLAPSSTSIDASEQSSTLTVSVTGGTNDSWTVQRNGPDGGVTLAYGSYTTTNGTFGSYVFSPTVTQVGTFTFYLNVTSYYGTSNGFSDTFSTTAIVTVYAALTATLTSTSRSVDAGQQSATITGTVSGGKLDYSWTVDLNKTGTLLSGTGSTDPYTQAQVVTAPNAPGTYVLFLNATDANGYTVHATPLVIVVSPALAPHLTPVLQAIDIGGSSYIHLNIVGGLAPYTWTLDKNGSLTHLATGVLPVVSYTFTPAKPATYTLYLNVTDSNGFTLGVTATVVVHHLPTGTLTPNALTIDVGQTSTLTITEAGGTNATWTLQRNGPGGGTTLVTNPTLSYGFSPSSTGTYRFYLNITDDFSNTFRTTATVVVSLALGGDLNVEPSPTEVGVNTFVFLNVTGGVAISGVSPSWTLNESGVGPSLASGTSPTLTDQVLVSFLTSGTYTFYLNVTDSNRAVFKLTYVLTVNPAPVASFSASATSIDIGQSSLLSGSVSGGVSPYAWTIQKNGSHTNLNSGTGATGSYNFVPTATGTYTFWYNVTDHLGVSTSHTATVTVSPGLSATLTGSPRTIDYSQQTSTLTLTILGGVGPYAWTLEYNAIGGGFNLTGVTTVGTLTYQYVFDPVTLVLGPGVYTFYFNVTSDGNGNTAQSSPLMIQVEPALSASLMAIPNAVDVGGTSTLSWTVSGGQTPYSYTLQRSGLSYNLATGSGATGTYTFRPIAPGIYTFYLNVTDTAGVHAYASATVTVSSLPLVTLTSQVTPTTLNPLTQRSLDAVNQTVIFTMTVVGGTGTTWNLYEVQGLSNTTVASNPSVHYTFAPVSQGTYSFVLGATDTFGKMAWSSHLTFTVSSPLIANLAVSPGTFTPGESLTVYTNMTGGYGCASPACWTIQNGSAYPAHLNSGTSNGTYTTAYRGPALAFQPLTLYFNGTDANGFSFSLSVLVDPNTVYGPVAGSLSLATGLYPGELATPYFEVTGATNEIGMFANFTITTALGPTSFAYGEVTSSTFYSYSAESMGGVIYPYLVLYQPAGTYTVSVTFNLAQNGPVVGTLSAAYTVVPVLYYYATATITQDGPVVIPFACADSSAANGTGTPGSAQQVCATGLEPDTSYDLYLGNILVLSGNSTLAGGCLDNGAACDELAAGGPTLQFTVPAGMAGGTYMLSLVPHGDALSRTNVVAQVPFVVGTVLSFSPGDVPGGIHEFFYYSGPAVDVLVYNAESFLGDYATFGLQEGPNYWVFYDYGLVTTSQFGPPPLTSVPCGPDEGCNPYGWFNPEQGPYGVYPPVMEPAGTYSVFVVFTSGSPDGPVVENVTTTYTISPVMYYYTQSEAPTGGCGYETPGAPLGYGPQGSDQAVCANGLTQGASYDLYLGNSLVSSDNPAYYGCFDNTFGYTGCADTLGFTVPAVDPGTYELALVLHGDALSPGNIVAETSFTVKPPTLPGTISYGVGFYPGGGSGNGIEVCGVESEYEAGYFTNYTITTAYATIPLSPFPNTYTYDGGRLTSSCFSISTGEAFDMPTVPVLDMAGTYSVWVNFTEPGTPGTVIGNLTTTYTVVPVLYYQTGNNCPGSYDYGYPGASDAVCANGLNSDGVYDLYLGGYMVHPAAVAGPMGCMDTYWNFGPCHGSVEFTVPETLAPGFYWLVLVPSGMQLNPANAVAEIPFPVDS